ncbi:glutamine amidotransferase family protein [Bradyrhizobium prioriisuperbiae]|uniref:class II glutamine amidotransferase n=1 Tax=Bradyrhizobium prioriisuperbiae TaxID=2854389 RepID=UPI0028F1089A|nr:glutamine amidotransferase family protein [Bradyrhizobium prioritasuperba]
MCGIAGLFLKTRSLEPELGSMLSGMLAVLSDRGPDSAGFAVYGKGTDHLVKLTLRLPPRPDAGGAVIVAARQFELASPIFHANHVIISIPADKVQAVQAFILQSPSLSGVEIVGRGRRMEIYKDVGLPADVAKRFDLPQMSGTHAIGHTRMATESAVTTKGAHPFSTGTDQCLVHNGSLSNHNGVRRELQREGLSFETDNDSEVAAGYLTWRMREGASLREALTQSLRDLDGFYTFVVGTESGFAVLRDAIACKPALMAETDDYVAFGSEYRALAGLPGIAAARVFEPEPATVYAWERH